MTTGNGKGSYRWGMRGIEIIGIGIGQYHRCTIYHCRSKKWRSRVRGVVGDRRRR